MLPASYFQYPYSMHENMATNSSAVPMTSPGQHTRTLSDEEEGITPTEPKLVELMSRTGYPISQTNGQRKYGPPPDWKGCPPKGAEVFVGKIPRDVYEDELVPLFSRHGRIYEMRLMMDFNGNNRGYAFVVFSTKKEAQNAVRMLNNYEIRRGKNIGVCPSVDNCRLFVGGIPKTVVREQILAEMQKITDGVQNVIVYPSANDKSKNRGFAFVEYDSHRSAAMARRKLLRQIPQPFTLWGHSIAVDWAEPELEVDDDIMQQVKVLYVRNLHIDTQESTIAEVFQKIAPVERVKKIRDYAFVHFTTKEDARKAKQAIDATKIDGCEVEVTLAKPVDRETYARHTRNKLMMNPTSATAAAAVASIPQLNPYAQYGLSMNLPTALAYQPFVLPNVNQLQPQNFSTASHVQQQQSPGMRGRGRPLRGAAGSRGARGAYSGSTSTSSHGRTPLYGVPAYWYDPKRKRGLDGPERMFDLIPGMELTPAAPAYTLKPPESAKSPIQVSFANLPGYQSVPNKICKTPEEAETYAAEYTLQQMNCSLDGSLLMAAPTQQQAASAAAAQAGMVQMFAYPDLNQAALFQQTALDPVAYAAAASAASAYGLQPHQLQQF
ncbi:probable RNA-binding protein 46 isoform X9 [Bolinopsis microptera]|uniref:probable RNA-binding protein 46 isoform X9 n=1 Tax=Bolinopsis microptera TaxID=2820187 RepID=UPI00307B0B8E